MPTLLYGGGGKDSDSNMTWSVLAHSIIKSALSYQSKASGPWLGVACAPNFSLQKANNLAATYCAEQKQNKEDAARPSIRIAATLWDLPEKHRGEVHGKMIQVYYIILTSQDLDSLIASKLLLW